MENGRSLPFRTLKEITKLCDSLVDTEDTQWCQYTLFGLYFKEPLWSNYEEFAKVHLEYIQRPRKSHRSSYKRNKSMSRLRPDQCKWPTQQRSLYAFNKVQ